MKRLWLAAPLVFLAMGCDLNPVAGIVPASPQSVSLQQSDLPSGVQSCSNETGDVAKTKDQDTQKEWQKQQKAGAKSGYQSVFADSSKECAQLAKSSSSPPKSAKLAGSIVIQYKDDATATTAYTSGVFGLKPSEMTSQQGVTTGTATGLGVNSVWFSLSFQGQSITIGSFQKKSFVCLVIGFNITEANMKKAATNMNGRIH